MLGGGGAGDTGTGGGAGCGWDWKTGGAAGDLKAGAGTDTAGATVLARGGGAELLTAVASGGVGAGWRRVTGCWRGAGWSARVGLATDAPADDRAGADFAPFGLVAVRGPAPGRTGAAPGVSPRASWSMTDQSIVVLS